MANSIDELEFEQQINAMKERDLLLFIARKQRRMELRCGECITDVSTVKGNLRSGSDVIGNLQSRVDRLDEDMKKLRRAPVAAPRPSKAWNIATVGIFCGAVLTGMGYALQSLWNYLRQLK